MFSERLVCLFSLACFALPGIAQVGAGPLALQSAPVLPSPRDHAFQGAVRLHVDATDTQRGIFRVFESIPVQSSGDVVLFYPEWETASHSATASAVELGGLRIHSDGHELAWRRDPFDVHAFHVLIPSGSHTLSLRFDYLPRSTEQIRPELIDIQWQRMLLYPAGWYARDVAVSASLSVPTDLQVFTSLTLIANGISAADSSAGGKGSLYAFAPVNLEQLVDAPVYAGRNALRVDLRSGAQAPVHLDVVADAASDLRIGQAIVDQLQALLTQADKVFGAAPFSHYEMLVSLSDVLSPGGGLEHLEEGENNLPAHFFADYAHQLTNRDLIAHEYVHAWNGRFRQPANLWSPTFNQPLDPSMLWVYEGQTEFWGRVLAARAGMRSYAQTLDEIALDAAAVANRPGRKWKNLADSTLDALYMPGHSPAWRDWQRREDYYSEGVLLWLDVDAHLRELSHGRVGLDDFARSFFATHGASSPTSTYTFEDVCTTLNTLVTSDWAGLLNRHLITHNTGDAMAGLTRAGWKLAYVSTPTESFLQNEAESKVTDVDSSIGLQVRNDGTVSSVVWNGPAFQVGLRPGTQLEKINGYPFEPTRLLLSIADSTNVPIHAGVSFGGVHRDIVIPYAGPLRYPKLVRIPGTRDLLTLLLSSR